MLNPALAPRSAHEARRTGDLAPALLLSVAVLVLSALRAVALSAGAPSIPTGVAFAVLLALPVAVAPGARRGMRGARPAPVLLGAAVGAVLLVPGAVLRARGMHAPGEAMPGLLLAAWAPAVTLVAVAEEVALRAGLQPRLRRLTGPSGAIVVTAAVFALMHLPLYGPRALPLDLGVGLVLGVLREPTGSVGASAAAHVVADLGAWWLP